MSPMVIAMMVAGAVTAMVLAGVMLYREYLGTKSLDDRLGRLTGQKLPTLEAAGILKDQLMQDEMKSFLPKLPNLERVIEQADLKMKPAQFWVLTLGMAALGAFVPVTLQAPMGAVLAAPAMAGLPLFYVNWVRKRRFDKLGGQLCEALELVARALRAGHSVAAAMQTVGVEMPLPISKEFGRVFEEQNLGLPLEQAMRNLSERVPNLDLKFFVTAVVIQRQTGGDLAEILDKISYVIRERFKIQGMVKALTGEGRMSGIVLIVLPFALLLLMMNLNYPYTSMLWKHPMGRWMSCYGIGSIIVGALAIRKIIQIKI